MTDFFISYTEADERWAEWIAYVLEEEGFSLRIQAWDFRPGANFVLEMQQAASAAERTILVLSPDYLKSQFASPEWAAAFANDPQGLQQALVPVMVRSCQPDGMLRPLIHINITDLCEDDARARLITGIRPGRAKPVARPAFPGSAAHSNERAFPGASPTPATTATPYMPRVRGGATDAKRRRFLKQAFEDIRAYFERALQALGQQTSGVDYDLTATSAVELTAEIFLHGKSVAVCRIWLGGMFSENGISYAEGRGHFGGNSCNEVLTADSRGGDLALSATMGVLAFGNGLDHLDLSQLTSPQAAEYLWRRFVARFDQ